MCDKKRIIDGVGSYIYKCKYTSARWNHYIKNQGRRAELTTSHVDQHEHEGKQESGLGLSFVKVRTRFIDIQHH